MRVAVLGGGRSGEHEVSLNSAAAVREGVATAGHEVVEIVLGRDGSWSSHGQPVSVTPGAGLLGCDVAWPVLHGPYGEDGTVQGLFEMLGVPYVGAGVLASAVCMDKVLSKDVFATAGFDQVDYAAVREHQWRSAPGEVLERLAPLGTPTFVKPARLGSSVGIARVGEGGLEMAAALDAAFAHDPLVIVEAYSSGLEIECSVLGNEDPEVSAPGEIVLTDADWYDYEAKYTPGGMELVVPARIPDAVADEVRAIAKAAFTRVGCAGLARVDFFVEGDRVLLNELNTMPGFTQTSVYPKLWEHDGLPFSALCDRLLALATAA
jgi:D-alanine-D-alanine ligase